MSAFEELDYRPTPMGPLTLRRRWVAAAGRDVHEVLLGDEHLMSSLFVEGERALSRLGLEQVEGGALQVLVGGLGLGHTAQAALEDARVARLEVVDALAPVIEWHREGLTPLGTLLHDEPRCRLIHADFFTFVADSSGVAWDAVLLDIDHAPARWLAPSHASFYSAAALRKLKARLRPGGVFAMWSDEAEPGPFLNVLREAFATADAQSVTFPNPLTGDVSACTIYRAKA
ncbi:MULTISPECIES: spermidine synthase [Brevundimonas]|uniref:spermidine synthase n=1 Tax=Brevundimonas TaxID=41275 RepID=UPI0015BC4FD9|nr:MULTISPECIES: spermidine synthase [Brevundimonas]MBD3832029.1 spermidine synthase [Brevundimonas sp.]MBK1970060.1 hypothetical protein [Brevundimonas diminuta]NWE51522.1 spermidine synthase [Brevundimonas sp. P7753]